MIIAYLIVTVNPEKLSFTVLTCQEKGKKIINFIFLKDNINYRNHHIHKKIEKKIFVKNMDTTSINY